MSKTKTQALPIKTAPVYSTMADLLPIIDITEYDAFVDRNNGIVDIIQIKTQNLFSAKENDVLYNMAAWEAFLKNYNNDLKIIYMGYPVDVLSQKSYIEKIIAQTKNPIFREELEKEKEELQHSYENDLAKEFYLMLFSKDKKEYNANMNMTYSILGQANLLQFLPIDKKIRILAKMQNMNLSLTSIPKIKDIPRNSLKTEKFNPYLVSAIQPQGNISFRDERFIRKGNGYEACIRAFGFPSQVKFGWIYQNLTCYDNTIITFDIGASDKTKTISNISTSLEEQQSRYDSAKNSKESLESKNSYLKLHGLLDMILEAGEVIKQVHVRIFCYEKTQDKLEKSTTDILTDLNNKQFKASIFLDEGKYEWLSLFTSLTEQANMPNRRLGTPMPVDAFTLGYPYHFSSLSDPFGTYYGRTETGGAVLFDPYQKDKMRTYYSCIILGVLGSGKSTLLKDMMKKDIIFGNYVRGFATNKEFNSLIDYFGGSVINLDGSQGFLNILHIYRTGDDTRFINPNKKFANEEERQKVERQKQIFFELSCYRKHIKKVVQWYKFLVPIADDLDTMILEKLLHKLYKKKLGYSTKSPENSPPITGLAPEQYPILSDLLEVVEAEMYSDIERKITHTTLSSTEFERLEKIQIVISTTIETSGMIFNGHSSIRDFTHEQMVFFSVEGLKNGDKKIFNAQIYSAMNLILDNLTVIGQPQKEQYEARNSHMDMSDIRKFKLYFDEAQEYVNASNLAIVNDIDSFNREARKLFGAIVLATHLINGFFPSNSSKEGVDAMTNLFSLTQYKFLFCQPSTSIPMISQVFGEELPINNLNSLAQMGVGECVLNIAGDTSVHFNVEVSEEEKALFTGGA